MTEIEAACPPFPRKSDLEALRKRNNVWKYQTALMLRDDQNVSWREMGERMHYSIPEARRIYYRARKFADENPDLFSSGSFAGVPTMTRDKARYLEMSAKNELYRAVLVMRGQGLMLKEISERTEFSVNRLVIICGKAAAMKQEAEIRQKETLQTQNQKTNPQPDRTSIPVPKTEVRPSMQKSDAWLLKAGINAQKYKSVLALRDGQRISWRKIAEQMHYSTSQIQRYYARAKKLMALSTDNPDTQFSESGETTPIIKQEDVIFGKAQIRNELYRTVLKLRDGHGLFFGDIAKQMGFSESYVMVLYREASRLKRMAGEQSTLTSKR